MNPKILLFIWKYYFGVLSGDILSCSHVQSTLIGFEFKDSMVLKERNKSFFNNRKGQAINKGCNESKQGWMIQQNKRKEKRNLNWDCSGKIQSGPFPLNLENKMLCIFFFIII